MGSVVYAIDAFPDDDLLWRIDWIGGVEHNSDAPSDPLVNVCLAQIPAGETNPLSGKSLTSNTKITVKITVGLLPYISIASVWRKQRRVVRNLDSYRQRLDMDTSSCRRERLGDLAMEQDGDPYAVMVPIAEIIRFYYAPSTRLAQALFWGEYEKTFDADQSGIFDDGSVKVHLRRWIDDDDAYTIARFICSPVMQHEARRLHNSLRLDRINYPSSKLLSVQAIDCRFPFDGRTTVEGICVPLNGPKPGRPRWLILELEQCFRPLPFKRIIRERDNDNTQGENAADENLPSAWSRKEDKLEGEADRVAPHIFQSDQEPLRGRPLKIRLAQERFPDAKGKELVKEEKVLQRYRHMSMKAVASEMITGLGTGEGTWGESSLKSAKLTTVQPREPKRRDIPVLPASMETFVRAIELLAQRNSSYEVSFIGLGEGDTGFETYTLASFPTRNPHKRKKIGWAWIKTEKRPRRVAIVAIRSGEKIAYALEIERTTQEHAILVLARDDWQGISAGEFRDFLLMCAIRRGWLPEDQIPGYRRRTTTHRELVDVAVLESRIWRKIEEVFKSAEVK
jgi:hypothetical protein